NPRHGGCVFRAGVGAGGLTPVNNPAAEVVGVGAFDVAESATRLRTREISRSFAGFECDYLIEVGDRLAMLADRLIGGSALIEIVFVRRKFYGSGEVRQSLLGFAHRAKDLAPQVVSRREPPIDSDGRVCIAHGFLVILRLAMGRAAFYVG